MHIFIAQVATTLIMLGGILAGTIAARLGVRSLIESPEFQSRHPMSDGDYRTRRHRLDVVNMWLAIGIGSVVIWGWFGLSVSKHPSGPLLFGLSVVTVAVEAVWIITLQEVFHRLDN